MRVLIALLVILMFFVSGCVENNKVIDNQHSENGAPPVDEEGEPLSEDTPSEPEAPPIEEQAIEACKQLCLKRLEVSEDLSDGPCLNNQIVPDWVCDVAHYPREDVDNLEENQCEAYRDKSAQHFVEVDEECELIYLE